MRRLEIHENRWIQYVYFNVGGIAYAIVATVNDYRDDKEKPVDPDDSHKGDWAVYCGSNVSTRGDNISERDTVEFAMSQGFKFRHEWAVGIFPDIEEIGLRYRE